MLWSFVSYNRYNSLTRNYNKFPKVVWWSRYVVLFNYYTLSLIVNFDSDTNVNLWDFSSDVFLPLKLLITLNETLRSSDKTFNPINILIHSSSFRSGVEIGRKVGVEVKVGSFTKPDRLPLRLYTWKSQIVGFPSPDGLFYVQCNYNRYIPNIRRVETIRVTMWEVWMILSY